MNESKFESKSENNMNDKELETFEERTRVVEDRLDRLELLRRELDSSHLEKMYVIKRSSNLGPLCPYYTKALRLWKEQQEKQLIEKLKTVLQEFDNV